MSDVQVTLVGYVGTDVDYRDGNGTGARAMFRVGSTPRYFDRHQGTWRDQETVWVTVKAWRSLAQNVSSSVRKGEPVIVQGRMRSQVWRDEQGQTRSRDVLEASAVGHDLTRGTSAFLRTRPVRLEPADDATDAGVHDRLEHQSAQAGPQPEAAPQQPGSARVAPTA